jgi:rubrerythrin
MLSEQARTLEGLNIAIQMELDGKEFYAKSAKESSNELGRNLLAALSAEEDIHREVFIKIYKAIKDKKGWPEVDFRPDGGRGLRTVFSKALEDSVNKPKIEVSELDTVEAARNMETRTYDFYRNQWQKATENAEKEFYENLAGQEQEHNLVLADYREYLRNPAGWFVKKEHPHFD